MFRITDQKKMKLYNTINNSHNNRNTNGVVDTNKVRTTNSSRYVTQFDDKEVSSSFSYLLID